MVHYYDGRMRRGKQCQLMNHTVHEGSRDCNPTEKREQKLGRKFQETRRREKKVVKRS